MSTGGDVEGSARKLSTLRRAVQATWDLLSWILAGVFATILRYDGLLPDGAFTRALILGAVLGIVQVAIGFGIQRVRGRHVIGSFDEIASLSLATGITAVLGLVILLVIDPPYLPRTVPLIAGAIALGIMLGGRFMLRAFRQRIATPREGERALIYGAGESGEQIVRQMLASTETGFIPVAFLDDDATKKNLRVQGVRVVGSSADLEASIRRFRPDILVVAIGAVRAEQLLDLDRRCNAFGVKLRVIPTTSEILGGAVKLGDITDVTDEDLLGRRPVTTDEDAIRNFLNGKRILITGAGGSIGSELARQVHRYAPAWVGLLDRDESALHAVQLSLDGRGLLDSDALILADIRDRERIEDIIGETSPEIVFHAAALKHLPLLERHPEEAHKTNVQGTLNLLGASSERGVPVFINISTDKAASPTSVLGMSKLKTEALTAEFGAKTRIMPDLAPRYLSVRFGNVIGSRGSVLETFRYQIANGGPVTVTDRAVTRFFMTVREAVHLVLQAAVLGENGDTLILDMGEPVAIAEVAQRLIDRSGRDIPVIYTGLRSGEKLAEVLVAEDEIILDPAHPLISRVRPK